MTKKQVSEVSKELTKETKIPVQPTFILFLIICLLALLVSNRNDAKPEVVVDAELQPTSVEAITEPTLQVVEPAVPATPSFVTMGNEGAVTLTASDIETIRIRIVEQVRLKPFFSGLTPLEKAESVSQYISGFNTALLQGSDTNDSLQRQLLYFYGSLLTGAAATGNQQAREAINEYVRGFRDDLTWIGPGNIEAPELTLAIVALDALGEQALAAEYVREVFAAKAALKRAALIEDLKLSGLNEADLPEIVSRPQSTVVPESISRPEPQLEPSQIEPVPTAPIISENNPPAIINPNPPQLVPTAYVALPQEGLAVSPYNWVITVQGIGRLMSGSPQTDQYFFEGYSTSEIKVFGRTFFYSEMSVRREMQNGSRVFTIVLIAGDRPTEMERGEQIKYDTIEEIIKSSLSVLH